MASETPKAAGWCETVADDLWRVVEDTARRRLAGESLSDDAVIAAHPRLMPTLGDRLRELGFVEQARRLATGSSGRFGAAQFPTRSADPAPPAIRGYEISGEPRRGGQAVVFRARQLSTQRDVALKLMRDGPLGGPSQQARFEQEVRILGRLQHPNIVAVHDGGVAEGRFFLVMDYVAGRPLDEYANELRRASTADHSRHYVRQVLTLFGRICDAVAAAHLRGVIHRDLKPSNIRVGDDGEPKVLDFGIAKLTGEDDAPALTQTGQFVGSLPWASPEQAEGAPGRIDIRTDVYALGIILFQMLTGTFPYDVSGGPRDVLDNILRAPPTRPRSLNRSVDDEVETIVLKCLAKEPERRYQSAGELADDVRSYLGGRPIAAKRDSAGYVLRKALRRHAVATTVAALFVLMVAASSVGLWTLYQREQAQAANARGEAARASLAEQNAEQRRRVAESERARAEQTLAFLQQMLASSSPEQARGHDLTVRDVLDKASQRIETEFADQPDMAASLRRTIGQTYRGLGDFVAAERHLRAALELRRKTSGDDSADAVRGLNDLAQLYVEKNDYAVAAALYAEAIETARRVLGDDHEDTLGLLHDLAFLYYRQGELGRAEPMFREAVDTFTRLRGDEDDEVLDAVNNLAMVCHDLGKHAEADVLYRRNFEVNRRKHGPDHPRTIVAEDNLAWFLFGLGRYDEVDALQTEAVELSKRVFGPEHPRTLVSLQKLGKLRRAQGRRPEAEQIAREVLEARRRLLGEDNIDTLGAMDALAGLLADSGRLDEAVAMMRQVLAGVRRQLGEKSPATASVMNNLASVLQDAGKLDEAEPLYRDALEMRRALFGPEHPEVAFGINNLAECLRAGGDAAAAEPLFREALALRRKTLGPDHPLVAASLHGLGLAAAAVGHVAAGEASLREAAVMRSRLLGETHVATLESQTALARVLKEDGRLADAEAELLGGYNALRAKLGDQDQRVVQVVRLLIDVYEAMGNAAAADVYRSLIPSTQPADAG